MKNQLKTIALLGGLSAAFVGVGSLLGDTAMIVALVIALATNLGAYFYADRIVLRLHRAVELSPASAPRLYGIVQELARAAEIPMPKVYLIRDPAPNAFATGRNPQHAAVAVTAGLLDLLSEREIRAVLAHEIAHVKNRDILVATIAAAIATAVTYLAHAAQLFAILGGGGDDEDAPSPLALLFTILVAPIAATLVQLGISRSREYLADEAGARLCGDPDALASALLKIERGVASLPHQREPSTASLFIVNPLTGGQTLRTLFSTHPSTQDRVRRLQALGRQRAPLGPGRFIRAA